jgi:hypothetical protein
VLTFAAKAKAKMTPERDFYFKFSPEKWRSDEQLRSCSFGARGLWIELLALAHKHDGYVLVNGHVPTVDELSQLVGGKTSEVSKLLTELQIKGVCSIDERGAIYSRRMVRDAERRLKNRRNGALGGNPKLTKPEGGVVNQMDNPSLNLVDKAIDIGSLSPLAIRDLDLALDLRKDPKPPQGFPRASLISAKDRLKHQTEHAFCDRVCVTTDQHREFIGKLGTPENDADRTLRAWYLTVLARHEGHAIGESGFAFWRNEFAAWIGTVTAPPVHGKGNQTAQSMQRTVERLMAREAKLGGGR